MMFKSDENKLSHYIGYFSMIGLWFLFQYGALLYLIHFVDHVIRSIFHFDRQMLKLISNWWLPVEIINKKQTLFFNPLPANVPISYPIKALGNQFNQLFHPFNQWNLNLNWKCLIHLIDHKMYKYLYLKALWLMQFTIYICGKPLH